VFLLVPDEFLRCGPRRGVQLPISLTPAMEARIVLLDRFRSAGESGLQFTPNGANHECLATIVAHVLESVQQGCRERGTERNRRRIRSVHYDSLCVLLRRSFSERESQRFIVGHKAIPVTHQHASDSPDRIAAQRGSGLAVGGPPCGTDHDP
jgi:hypothetical protein